MLALFSIAADANEIQDRSTLFNRSIIRLIEHGDLSDVEFSREALPFALGLPQHSGREGGNEFFQTSIYGDDANGTQSSFSFSYIVYHPADHRYQNIGIIAIMTLTNIAPHVCITTGSLLERLPAGTQVTNDGLSIGTERIEIAVGQRRFINIIIPARTPRNECFSEMSLIETEAL